MLSVLGYYGFPTLGEPASDAVPGSWNVYFLQRQVGSIRKPTELKAGSILVTQPAHESTVIPLNSYGS